MSRWLEPGRLVTGSGVTTSRASVTGPPAAADMMSADMMSADEAEEELKRAVAAKQDEIECDRGQ